MSDNQLIDKNGEVNLGKLFWLGFALYTIGFVLTVTDLSHNKIWQILQYLGLGIFLSSTIGLLRNNLDNLYLKLVFTIYLLWIVGVIVRGFIFEKSFILSTILNPFDGIFLYLAPLIILFPRTPNFLKSVFSTISVLNVSYIIFCLVFIKTIINPDLSDKSAQAAIEYSSKALSIPAGFLLITYSYHSDRRKTIAIIGLILTLLLAIIRARRGLVFMAVFPLVMALYFYLTSAQKQFNLLFVRLIIVLFFSVFLYFYINSFQNENYGIFGSLLLRAGEDTRSEVVLYFIQDMTPKDWIIGKGMNGQYFCPTDGGLYRYGIETDYLNIILKGGIISLGLMLLILLPAVYKGLFKSNNILTKAAGVWILFYLLCLYPSPNTKFTLNYLLVWISVGMCYSKNVRNLSDDFLKDYFHS